MKVAIAAFFALFWSAAPLLIYTQSIFLEPMTSEFGWTHSQYFMPLFFAGILGAFAAPLLGHLGDRYGVRPLLLPGIAVFGLSYGALALVNGSLAVYTLLIFCLILAANVHGVLFYTKALLSWPSRRPALLLAIVLAGSAAGGVAIPPATIYIVEEFGWRAARLWLATAVFVIALPVAWTCVRTPAIGGLASTMVPKRFGSSGRQALRSRNFWLIAVVIGLSGAALNGLLANMVPLLRAQGYSLPVAASSLSVIAGAHLAARFVAGWCLDRFQTPRIGTLWFACAFAGIFIATNAIAVVPLVVGMALMGAGLGAEMELAAYYIRRYFGTRNYGQIYGYIFGIYTLGVAAGPLMIGATFDFSGGYALAIVLSQIFLIVSGLLLLKLGPYAYEASIPELPTVNIDGEPGTISQIAGQA